MTEHPVLLEDLANNLQQLRASLSPDDWSPDAPGFYLQRQESGMLEVKVLDVQCGEPAETATTEVAEHKISGPSSGSNRRKPKASKSGFWRRFCPFKRYLLVATLPTARIPHQFQHARVGERKATKHGIRRNTVDIRVLLLFEEETH